MANSASSTPVKLEKIGSIALISVNHAPANILSLPLRRELLSCFLQAEGDTDVNAIVITSAVNIFSAGADITEIDSGAAYTAPILPDILDRIDASSTLCVAAINGAAIGGGMELTLACDYRVGGSKAAFQLPEITLGLLPGAGGTQRLPRITGARHALNIILSGKSVSAEFARDIDLLDHLVMDDECFLEDAIAFTQALVRSNAPVRDCRFIGLEKCPEVRGQLELQREAIATAAPDRVVKSRCIDAVEAAYDLALPAGIELEAQLFREALAEPYAQAMRYLFEAERSAKHIPEMDSSVPAMSIEKVAVIGAGSMGRGIATNFSSLGLPTIIVDRDPDAVEKALQHIEKSCGIRLEKGLLDTTTFKRAMDSLVGATTYDAVGDVDLVIEAVFEDLGVKQEVFVELDKHCKQETILATNTSTLNVNAIADFTTRPDKVVGLHFFNPADRMRLLEVIRGKRTSASTLKSVFELARAIGKLPIVVNVCYGFVANRMLEPFAREAFRMILEGACPEQVDRVLTDFGFSMGVVSMYDLVGLDVAYQARSVLSHKEQDPGYHALMDELYALKRYGRKTGLGIYRYDTTGKKHSDPQVAVIATRLASELGIRRREISPQEILERCLFTLINEGAQILEEKIAYRASDCDLIWVNGFGFPNWRGGPLHYANQIGIPVIHRALLKYREQLGDYGRLWYTPSVGLEKLATTNSTFQ